MEPHARLSSQGHTEVNSSESAFTLVELLAVVAIISLFIGVIGLGIFRGGSQGAGLRSAQTTVVGLLSLTRSHAALSGNRTGLFLDTDISAQAASRSHRVFIVAEEIAGSPSTWKAVSDIVTLPEGCYALSNETPSSDWIGDGSSFGILRSTALNDANPTSIEATISDRAWAGVVFSALGTVSGGGKIVLSIGRATPLDSSSPLKFQTPENVRGVFVSGYGQITLLNSRDEF